MNKKELPLRARVQFVNTGGDKTLEGKNGTVLGKTIVGISDYYIVLLDDPRSDALAIVITEACLNPITEDPQ